MIAPKAVDTPARAKPGNTAPGRRIDAATIADMAKLCAKSMLTESEACRHLDIKPRTWFDFKSRAGRNQQFADMVEAFRAAKIEQLIARIQASADGADGVKYPDWRAALALLKITDQRRFGDSTAVETTNNTLVLGMNPDQVAKLVSLYAGEVQRPALPPPATVEDVTVDCPPAIVVPQD